MSMRWWKRVVKLNQTRPWCFVTLTIWSVLKGTWATIKVHLFMTNRWWHEITTFVFKDHVLFSLVRLEGNDIVILNQGTWWIMKTGRLWTCFSLGVVMRLLFTQDMYNRTISYFMVCTVMWKRISSDNVRGNEIKEAYCGISSYRESIVI